MVIWQSRTSHVVTEGTLGGVSAGCKPLQTMTKMAMAPLNGGFRATVLTTPFTSHAEDDPLLKAVATLHQLNTVNQRKLPDDISLDFVPDRWRRFVQNHGEPSRRAYELCALSTLRDALRAGDISVPTSRRYADPETYLIPKSQWPRLRAAICEELHLDLTGSERLSQRVAELKTLLPR